MYLVRRVFKVKPRTARRAAPIIAQLGRCFEDAGQRTPTRVYISGGTVPGPADTVYMDWTEEALQSPYRDGNQLPQEISKLAEELRQFVEDSYIEFYELYVD